jgi:cell division protein FtsL
MGKFQNNQKGFTLVEGLFIVLALTVIVGVGFYVMNANKDNEKSETASQTTRQKTEIKPAEKQETKSTQQQKTDVEQIIEAAKKAGVENFDGSRTPVETAKVDSIVDNNAKGSAGYGTEGGGYVYIAHKKDANWEIVYTGRKPGRDIGEKYKLPTDWYSVEDYVN